MSLAKFRNQSNRWAFGALLAFFVSIVSAHSALSADADSIAVIIGNSNYVDERVPDVDYAHRDADAFRTYVEDVLGYRDGNIIDLRDATQAELFTTFGNESSPRGLIWQYIRPGISDVVVFYSGHGVPGVEDRRGYLLPSDANPATVEINGYAIDLLFENLMALEAHSVTIYLDACFSGDSHAGMLIHSASPVFVSANLPANISSDGLTALTAASGEQLASWDEERGHGLFTGYLLDGLYGAADGGSIGNEDGQVSVYEMKAWLDEEMTFAARRNYGRLQEATILGDPDRILSSVPDFAWVGAHMLETHEQAALPEGNQVAAPNPEPEPGPVDVGDNFGPGTVFWDCANCPEMVVVPAGSFMMGSQTGEEGRINDEGPMREVRFAEPFAVGVYEVTFTNWDACIAAGGCGGYRPFDYWGRGSRPVVDVSWEHAQDYVAWLRVETGESYRLLSEAEWEYVARAGTQTRYWWGDDISEIQASFDHSFFSSGTQPVGSYNANAFGLYDVHGNVWEWTQDCWNGSYFGAPADGNAWMSGDCSKHILRGGGWGSDARFLRSAYRYWLTTDVRTKGAGFRVARDIR